MVMFHSFLHVYDDIGNYCCGNYYPLDFCDLDFSASFFGGIATIEAAFLMGSLLDELIH